MLSLILCCPSCLSALIFSIFSYILIQFLRSVNAPNKANALVFWLPNSCDPHLQAQYYTYIW